MIAACAKWKNLTVEKIKEKLMATRKMPAAENMMLATSC
jgi:hypothetical protein